METMNIHPLVVHFPIALLALYSLLEVARLPVITRQAWWFGSKAMLVILGTIGGWFAIQTGEMASELYQGTQTMNLIELHEQFGNASIVCYVILAVAYLIACADRASIGRGSDRSLRLWILLTRVAHIILFPAVAILLAILGFVLLSITGALGGSIVYGPETDPIVSMIYHLFFP